MKVSFGQDVWRTVCLAFNSQLPQHAHVRPDNDVLVRQQACPSPWTKPSARHFSPVSTSPTKKKYNRKCYKARPLSWKLFLLKTSVSQWNQRSSCLNFACACRAMCARQTIYPMCDVVF
jgi:hypothetical protein